MHVDFHLVEAIAKRSVAKVWLDIWDKTTVDQLFGNLIDARLPRADDGAKDVLLSDWRDNLIDKLANVLQWFPIASRNQICGFARVGNHVLCVEHFAMQSQTIVSNHLQEPAHEILVGFVQGIKGSIGIAARYVEINGQLDAYEKGKTQRIVVGHALDRHVVVKAKRSTLAKAGKSARQYVHSLD